MLSEAKQKPSVTNHQLRIMGWISFSVAVLLAIASGVGYFEGVDTLVIAFLAHTAGSFSMPTVRNMMEDKHAADTAIAKVEQV